MFREKFPVPEEWAKRAWIDDAKYQQMYRRSIDDPEGFWDEQGKPSGMELAHWEQAESELVG